MPAAVENPSEGTPPQQQQQTPPATPPAEPSNPPGQITMTQAELDAKFAQHKRGLQQELAEAKRKADSFDKLQSQVQTLSDGEHTDVTSHIEAMQQTIFDAKTKEQQAEEALGTMESQLKKAKEAEQLSTSRFETAMIARQISDDASDMVVEGPGREGAIEYFQLKLSQVAEFDHATGETVVNWEVTDEDTGTVSMKKIPVKDALKSMESNPSKYGRYFRSTVNGGSGGETVDGVKRTNDGGVDFAGMDFVKFQELAKKNPALLQQAAEKLTF